jgi:hypothetical protein
MGNTTSDVNDSLKAQADSENGPELYKLVNVSGCGELARLMKHAVQNKNYRVIDQFIRAEVPKYLYNEGKGEQVSYYNSYFGCSIDLKTCKRFQGSNRRNCDSTLRRQGFSIRNGRVFP